MIKRVLFCAVMVAASGAFAQNYVIQSQMMPFAPLTAGMPITAWTVHTGFSDGADEGYFALNLPFSFPFYGNTYNTVYIESNGFVAFGAPCGLSTCYSNRAFPSTTTTLHNII